MRLAQRWASLCNPHWPTTPESSLTLPLLSIMNEFCKKLPTIILDLSDENAVSLPRAHSAPSHSLVFELCTMIFVCIPACGARAESLQLQTKFSCATLAKLVSAVCQGTAGGVHIVLIMRRSLLFYWCAHSGTRVLIMCLGNSVLELEGEGFKKFYLRRIEMLLFLCYFYAIFKNKNFFFYNLNWNTFKLLFISMKKLLCCVVPFRLCIANQKMLLLIYIPRIGLILEDFLN